MIYLCINEWVSNSESHISLVSIIIQPSFHWILLSIDSIFSFSMLSTYIILCIKSLFMLRFDVDRCDVLFCWIYYISSILLVSIIIVNMFSIRIIIIGIIIIIWLLEGLLVDVSYLSLSKLFPIISVLDRRNWGMRSHWPLQRLFSLNRILSFDEFVTSLWELILISILSLFTSCFVHH